MSIWFRAAVLAICVLALSACAGNPYKQMRNNQLASAPTELPVADPVMELIPQQEYRIGPSDLITVTVFKVEDLNRDVRVGNDGNISLPLIGTIVANGMSVPELQSRIANAYGSRYLQNPQVTVFVKEYASQRVTVAGAVKKPGIFPVMGRITLMQALAQAEGLNETASEQNILVFRTSNGQRQFARFDLKAMRYGQIPDPALSAGDVVIVDTSSGRVALQNFIKMAPLITVWRAYR